MDTVTTQQINGRTMIVEQVSEPIPEPVEVQAVRAFVATPPLGVAAEVVEYVKAMLPPPPSPYRTRIRRSYYPSGNVDVIEIAEVDATDAVMSLRRIKHPDGNGTPHIMSDMGDMR